MCCEKADCDIAFMPQNHCYSVSCFSDEHCETRPADVPNFVVQLVKVRRVTIPDPSNESPKEEDIWKSRPPDSQKDNINEQGNSCIFSLKNRGIRLAEQADLCLGIWFRLKPCVNPFIPGRAIWPNDKQRKI